MEVEQQTNLDLPRKPLTIRQKFPQYLAATMVNIAAFCGGCANGWTSPIIDRLRGITGPYEPLDRPLTEDEVSWVESLVTLGAILGPLCGGIFMDRFGRKYTFLVMGGVTATVGWIIILAAHNPAALYAARFLTGISIGSASTLGPVYIGEVSSASERGALCSMHQLMTALGVMVQNTVGSFVSYHVLAGINLAFPVIFVVSFFFMPESPYYLLAVGKKEEAEASLVWFRGGGRSNGNGSHKMDVTQELEGISLAIEESGIHDTTLLDSFNDLFATPGNRRAFLITAGLMFFQRFSGINAIIFNAQSIFRGNGEEKAALTPSQSTIVTSVIPILSSWVVTVLVDRLGRRPLLLFSCAFSSVSLIAFGIHAYVDVHQHSTAVSLSWLPLTSVVVFIVSFNIGLGPLTWAVFSEVFPSTSKSAAGILIGCFCWILAFVVTRMFQPLTAAAGVYGAFWLFAGCCAAGFVFVAILLPETKCKTLEEIQKDLVGK